LASLSTAFAGSVSFGFEFLVPADGAAAAAAVADADHVPKQKLRALFGKYQAKFALNGEMVSAK